MKLYRYLLLFIFLFLQLFAQANNNKVQHHTEIESIINLVHKYGIDTITIKNHLKEKIAVAKKENDIPTLWAYNILMADVYSIIYDNSNPISDAYFKTARELLKKGNYPELEFVSNVHQGYYYFVYRKVSKAFPYFLEANYLEPKINFDKVPAINDHLKFTSNFFSYIGNHERAIDFLKIALPYTQAETRDKINLLNSLGIYHMEVYNDSLAKFYLKEALQEAKKAKDSVWIGIIYGNLSEYSWKEGKIKETYDFLKQNIELSLRYNETLDAMRSNLKIASYYLSQDDSENADKHVHNSLSLMEDKPYFLTYRVEALKILADIAYKKNNPLEERKYLKEYVELKEKLDQQVNNEEIKKISWKFEVEKYEQTAQQNLLKQKEIKRTYTLFGLLAFLVTIIFILLINRSRSKIKIKNIELEKKQLKLAHEKYFLDNELASVKNSLKDFTETINQNNIIISKLRLELAESTTVDAETKNKVSDQLNNMLKSHLLTQERWVDFRNEFELAYPDYLKNLKKDHPQLTENDLRILTLMKLDLTNKSMGDLLGISLEGVKKAKQRLKKKIDSSKLLID